jgi:hypothetical protein
MSVTSEREIQIEYRLSQEVARFAVSAPAAIKLIRRVRQTGSAEPGKIGGKPLLADHEGLLRELTATRKGITLAEIRKGAFTQPNRHKPILRSSESGIRVRRTRCSVIAAGMKMPCRRS